jgi:hypothetical protein
VKPLTLKNFVEICDATAAQIEAGAALLGKATEADVAWVETGLSAGQYQAAAVTVENRPRFLLVFHVNEQKVLFINAAVQLAKDYCDFEVLVDSMVAIARDQGCRAIEAMTLRAGLLKKVMQHGFVPIGVSFQKTL